MKSIVLGSVLGALLLLLNGCGSDGGDGATQTIAERAVASDELSTLVAALSAADLVDMFNGTDVFTVFAPTDDAFKKLDSDLLACLLDPVGIPKLTDLLKYHVVAGKSLTQDLKGDDVMLTTLYNNATLSIKTVDGILLTVNGVNQTVVDIVATNGVIHEIDGVLLPDGFEEPQCGTMSVADLAVDTTTLSTLVAALTAADLVDVFNGTDVFTVFAPTDDAFKKLDADLLACLLDPVGIPKLTELLKYHVVSGYALAKDLSNDEKLTTIDNKATLTVKVDGDSVMVNNANVTLPNNYATNGVVHVLDGVLIPDDFEAPQCGTMSVADLAVDTTTLSTLVAALSAASLVDVFNGTDVFTVFAPTDDAFKKLDADLLACLLDPVGIPKLTELLKYHVVSGYALAKDLTNDENLETIDNKATLTVKVNGESVMVNNANVTIPNNYATNGVVHVIDGVLIPDGFDPPQCGTMSVADLAVNTTALSTLVAALSAAGLVDVFNGTDVFTVFAPTDEAFKALDPDLLACLLDPVGIPKLTELLKYHVVPGYTLAKDLSNDEKLTTLDNKTTLAVKVDGESVMVNNANVTLPNNYATNGVVHVIDGVLIPDDFDPPTCNKTFSSIQV